MKTIEEVLDYAEKLNELHSEDVDLDVTIKGIEDPTDIFKLSQQERGQYFEPSDMHKHHWCAVTLGKIDFIITSKNIEL